MTTAPGGSSSDLPPFPVLYPRKRFSGELAMIDTRLGPDDLADAMEGCFPENAFRLIRDESDYIKQPGESYSVSDSRAASKILEWYQAASEDLDTILRVGLARWATSRRPAKVWATLLGLKAQGVVSLPL